MRKFLSLVLILSMTTYCYAQEEYVEDGFGLQGISSNEQLQTLLDDPWSWGDNPDEALPYPEKASSPEEMAETLNEERMGLKIANSQNHGTCTVTIDPVIALSQDFMVLLDFSSSSTILEVHGILAIYALAPDGNKSLKYVGLVQKLPMRSSYRWYSPYLHVPKGSLVWASFNGMGMTTRGPFYAESYDICTF